MNRYTIILAALVAGLLLLLGVVLKDSYEKSAKISQLQTRIDTYVKAEKDASTTINQGRKDAESNECYNARMPDTLIKLLRK